MIDAVRGLWRRLGLELTPLAPPDGRGTPALYGELPGPENAPTLLLYGHYDVQPTGDVARWTWQGVACEPFVFAAAFSSCRLPTARTYSSPPCSRSAIPAES